MQPNGTATRPDDTASRRSAPSDDTASRRSAQPDAPAPRPPTRPDGSATRRAVPTARGYAIVAVGTACAVAGNRLGYPELTALAGACLAALLIAALWLLSGRRLGVSRAIAPARVARGGDAVGTVRVRNAGRRGTRALTAVDRVGPTAVRIPVPALAPGTASATGYRLPTGRRGELAVGPLLLRADDPFGLLRRVLVFGEQTSILVRPRTVPLSAGPTGRRAWLDGPTSDTAPGGSTTFHTLRAYVPGDDLRHVHWRTSARTDTLMVRHLVDSTLPETAVVLDLRAAAYPAGEADLDVAVDAAATIAAGLGTQGYPVTVYTSAGDRLRVRGAHNVTTLLDQLAVLPPDRRATDVTALGRAVEQARHATAPGTALAVVTGPRGEMPGRAVAAARSHFGRVVLMQASEEGTAPDCRTVEGLAVAPVHRAEDAAALWQRRSRW